MKYPKDLNELIYENAFDFLTGFFITPFCWIVITTSIKLISDPKSISEAVAIIYIALLVGIYNTFRIDSKSVGYFGKPKGARYKLFGLSVFALLFLVINH